MPVIKFIIPGGRELPIEVASGTTVMRAAVENLVPGIIGDCGGCSTCATCHVYVDAQWLEKLPPRSESEADMLEGVLDLRPNSRLGCQITVDTALDGVVVEVPEAQF